MISRLPCSRLSAALLLFASVCGPSIETRAQTEGINFRPAGRSRNYHVVLATEQDDRRPSDPPGLDMVVLDADPEQRAPLRADPGGGAGTYCFSPDEKWLFAGYTEGSGMGDGELFRHEEGPHFVPVKMDEMFHVRAWNFCVGQQVIDASQVADRGADVRIIDFVAWSLDSSRLLVSLRAGVRRGSPGIYGWNVYWNVRTESFELTEYLRTLNRGADIRWGNGKARAAFVPAMCAEPLPGALAAPPVGRDKACVAAGRLEAAFGDYLETLEPDKKGPARNVQRSWRKICDDGLRTYERFGQDAAAREARHWQYLTDCARRRMVEFDPQSSTDGGFAAYPQTIGNGDKLSDVEREVVSPSPDGRYALRRTSGFEDGTKTVWFDLVTRGSGKVVQPHILESGDEPGRFSATALWSPDSRRIAFSISRSHRTQYVGVFQREGDIFREIPLPVLPEARIPDKAFRGRDLGHCVSGDYQTAKHWKSNGSLIVESDTTYDGDGTSVTALRTTVLDLGPGPYSVRIAKSSVVISHGKE